MAHTITLSDEQYERLTKAAKPFAQTPHGYRHSVI